MASTFSATLTAQAQPWCVLIRIEGVGPDASQYTFCTEVPSAADSTYYKPWLTEIPDILSQRLVDFGGISEAGGFQFSLVDVSGTLTSFFRVFRPALTTLQTSVSVAATSFTVISAAAFTVGGFYYLGVECVEVTAASGVTLTVTRARRGTAASPHADGTFIYQSIPYATGRTVSVLLSPFDAPTSEAVQIGTYTLRDIKFRQSFTEWVFTCSNDLAKLKQAVAVEPATTLIVQAGSTGGGPAFTFEKKAPIDVFNDGSFFYAHEGKSVIRIDYPYISEEDVIDLGVGYTAPLPRTINNNQLHMAQVFSADTRHASSFRWSKGTAFGGTASGSPSDGTWLKTAHWVDIILAIALSPSTAGDADSTSNYDSAHGNWCCLPVGVGLGMSYQQIDWASWMSVRSRTLGYNFPSFFFGHAAQTFDDLISGNFLKLIGASITQSQLTGRYSLILPRASDTGRSPAFTLTADNIQNQNQSLRASLDETRYALQLVGRTESGEDDTISFSNQGTGPFGRFRPLSSLGMEKIELKASCLVFATGESFAMAENLATRALTRRSSNSYTFSITCLPDQLQLKLGDVGSLTCSLIPDLVLGASGVTSLLVMVSSIEFSLDPLATNIELKTFGGAQPFPHGAAASITSASGPSGGNYTLTCAANTFSSIDGLDSLPVKDVSGFVAGDKVVLQKGTDGAITATSQTVVSVSAGANQVVVDGDFGGVSTATMATRVLVPSDFAAASATQKTKICYLGDAEDNLINATQAAALYGDV